MKDRATFSLVRYLIVAWTLVFMLVPVHALDPVQPTFTKVHYGPEEQQYLDFWKAKSEQPTPLVMKIHGGGWLHGPIEPYGKDDQFFLNNGISVAHITYTFTSSKPLPAPVYDAVRALQFLRSKASEWNIDSSRVVVSGFSAGGCSALWIATHDDLANPQAADPVERESTRVSGAYVFGAQTTIEPSLVKGWTGDVKHPMIHSAGGFKNTEMMFKAIGEDPMVDKLYKEFSPILHLSANDPPILLSYKEANLGSGGIHAGAFGLKFKEKAEALGIKNCWISVSEDREKYPDYPGKESQFVLDVFARKFGPSH